MSNDQENQDFGAILAAFEQEREEAGTGKDPKVGEKVSGKILSIGRDYAFVDLGTKSEGMVATSELLDDEGDLAFGEGDTVEGVVTGRDSDSRCLILRVKPGRGEAAREEIAQAYEHGIPVEGRVTGTNKGGLEVEVAGLKAFCPVSQIDLSFIEEPSVYVGRRLTFRITRFEPAGRGGQPNVVLSRRVLLEEEAEERAKEVRKTLEEGKTVRGTVSSITSYGAFVDLGGGIEGLLHVSEMGHERVEDPKDVVRKGEHVEVKILKIEEGEGKGGKPMERISLSRKALEADPWDDVEERFPVGTQVTGRVMGLETYGAFVRLAPGIQGLVHVSELGAARRISHAREVVELGQDLEVRVLDVDEDKRRISLTRVLESAEDVDLEEAAQQAEGSGGFGAMADFFEKSGGEDEGKQGES